MKRLIIGIILTGMILFINVAECFAYKKPSQYPQSISYNEAINSNKLIALYFHVDWCGYCVRFSPVFEKLKKKYASRFNFVRLDAEKYPDLASEYGVHSYPSFFLVNPKKDVKYKVPSKIVVDSFKVSQEMYKFMVTN